MARKKATEEQQARRFAVILGILLAVLAGFSYWRHHPTRSAVMVVAGAVVFACAFLTPPVWRILFHGWMRFAEALSFVMTRVILTAFYYGILTPYGLVSRLFRSDPLDLDWKRRKPSYWVERPERTTARESYAKQF